MCSTYTWLDVLCWNHHGDLVNVVSFLKIMSEFIMIYLIKKKKKKGLLSVPV